MTEKKQGGKRTGAGRKQRYGEPTRLVRFSVPISKVPEIEMLVNQKLESYKPSA